MTIEKHPFTPFLPAGAKVLMLGTFPPKSTRWTMDFYYPNFINDMWRIVGLVFCNDKDRFVRGRSFDQDAIMSFCAEKGIALYDTASEIRRLKDNASDKFLDIVTPTDTGQLLRQLPECLAVVATGAKAAEVLCETFACPLPKMGEYSVFSFEKRELRLYRLPSSSRAYPLALEKKAAYYSRMFSEITP